MTKSNKENIEKVGGSQPKHQNEDKEVKEKIQSSVKAGCQIQKNSDVQ